MLCCHWQCWPKDPKSLSSSRCGGVDAPWGDHFSTAWGFQVWGMASNGPEGNDRIVSSKAIRGLLSRPNGNQIAWRKNIFQRRFPHNPWIPLYSGLWSTKTRHRSHSSAFPCLKTSTYAAAVTSVARKARSCYTVQWTRTCGHGVLPMTRCFLCQYRAWRHSLRDR